MSQSRERLLTDVMTAEERSQLAWKLYQMKLEELEPRVIEIVENMWKDRQKREDIWELKFLGSTIADRLGYRLRHADIMRIVRNKYEPLGYRVYSDEEYDIITITTEKCWCIIT